MDAIRVTFGRMNQKGIITRDARLSMRVPSALKEAIERYATRTGQTVADAMIPVLEEAMRRAARSDPASGKRERYTVHRIKGSDKRQVKNR